MLYFRSSKHYKKIKKFIGAKKKKIGEHNQHGRQA
jgi:hypothetical protein